MTKLTGGGCSGTKLIQGRAKRMYRKCRGQGRNGRVLEGMAKVAGVEGVEGVVAGWWV